MAAANGRAAHLGQLIRKLAGRVVTLEAALAALIAGPDSLLELVAVGDAGQDQQTGGDQLVAEVQAGCGVPEAGEDASLLRAEVVAAARRDG